MSKEHSAAVAAVALSLSVPSYVSRVASVLNHDLYDGPAYYVPGECTPGEASCFDAGARRFDFEAGAALVRSWADEHIGTMYYDTESGFVSDRAPEPDPCPMCEGSGYFGDDLADWMEVSPRAVVAELFGAELVRTVLW